MNIQSLLNPYITCDGGDGSQTAVSSTTPAYHPVVPCTSILKRQKIPKDAAIFSEGTKIVGHVNYPPHEEARDEHLLFQHRRYKVFPIGGIRSKGARHIPYNSDKKDFMDKTGRESFEVFQYTYQVPGEENKEYVVLWDYNVGLVRMTPFFKSLKHSKTIPAKALRENSGLKDVSYSITGGALIGQGYWMPYQAAKAIAATFCWHIRWALTPVFGYNFPDTCFSPDDSRYGKFLIDPLIVQACTAETNRFKREGAAYRTSNLLESATADTLEISDRGLPRESHVYFPRKSEESGYYTGEEHKENRGASPQESPRGSTFLPSWTCINDSVSPSLSPIVLSPAFDRAADRLPHLRLHLREHGVYLGTRPTSVPPGYFPPILAKRNHSDIANDCYTIGDLSVPSSVASTPRSTDVPNLSNPTNSPTTIEVAQTLMQLKEIDQVLSKSKRTRR